VSTMQSPPPDAPVPGGPPERRCPRCGSTLAPDQEWCLACGAAADTEVVEARGWRVPLYLGGGLTALAVLGVILAIVALATRDDEVAQNPKPTPSAVGTPPAVTPVPTSSAVPTTSPVPTTSAVPTTSPTPESTASPEPTPTDDGGNTDTGTGSTFPDWTGGDGYTIIIESNKTLEGAEKVAQKAQDAGETVGILNSDDFSSLNGGYYVVFSGTYATENEAEDNLDSVKKTHPDAYVRQIKQ
jgi:sporulation related protein